MNLNGKKKLKEIESLRTNSEYLETQCLRGLSVVRRTEEFSRYFQSRRNSKKSRNHQCAVVRNWDEGKLLNAQRNRRWRRIGDGRSERETERENDFFPTNL